jgi:hypothetical protein
MYLAVSSSSRWPTRPTITIDKTDVATIRTINPTAMATIRRLIDRLIIDPEIFLRFLRVRGLEMALPPSRGQLILCAILRKLARMTCLSCYASDGAG